MSSGHTKGEALSAEPTLWSSEAWAAAPDTTLLALTRDGSAEAFGELWRRHLPAACAVANRHRGRSAPEDVVAEAAARVLALIREGRGPEESFRAYFLSAVRTVAIDQGRRDLRLVPTEHDDLEELAPPLADPFAGLAVDEDGMALVRTAFAELPERDRRILWHTTVEGAAPRAVAPVLGMTANAVSVRAMRAREALRANFLDARAARGLAAADSDECRWTVEHLGAYVRGRLPKRQTERARAHVEGCPHAAALAEDLRVIHDGFPALVVPVVLAAGLTSPGFVTGGAAAALSAATTAASGAAASGAAASDAVGAAPSGQVDATGVEGVADHGGLARDGLSRSPATDAPSAAGRAVDAVSQLAGRATNVAAALAVTTGLAAALAVPGPALADAPLPGPRVTASATALAPRPVPAPATPGGAIPSTGGQASTTSPGVLAAGTPGRQRAAGLTREANGAAAGVGATPGSPRTRAATTPAAPVAEPAPSPGPPTPAPPRPRPSTPTPTTPPAPPSDPSTPPAPPVPSDPPPAAPTSDGSAGPVVSASLVKDGETARVSVRVRTADTDRLTVRISNRGDVGRLTVRNSSWDCTQAARAAVSCIGRRGSAVLDQSGTGGVVPLVVRVTDAAGRTWTETVRPA